MTPSPGRRRLLVAAAAGTGLAAVGGSAWLRGASPAVDGLPDFGRARAWVMAVAADPAARTRSGWPIAQLFEHAAQSIEYSIDGYPSLRAGWFRAGIGPLAFAAFARRGRMHHDLDEPIPGAPPLVADSAADGAGRLLAALDRFESHRGPLAPHFAFGTLDHTQFARAHLLHLADHARRVEAPAADRPA